MDLSNSHDTKFKNSKLMQNYLKDRHAKLTPRYSREPYNLNLYFPLPRKSGSANFNFPVQMCNLSNSDQKECTGIALHHAVNKVTFTCQNETLHCVQKFSAKNAAKRLCHKIRSKLYYPKIWMQNIPIKIYAIEIGGKI